MDDDTRIIVEDDAQAFRLTGKDGSVTIPICMLHLTAKTMEMAMEAPGPGSVEAAESDSGVADHILDPVGLFARDLRECLAAQLAERDRLDPAMARLLENLKLLARRELRRLAGICDVDAEDLAEISAELYTLLCHWLPNTLKQLGFLARRGFF